MNDILLWKMKNNLIEISWGIKPKLGPFSIRSWKLWAMVHRCRKHFPSIRSMWPIWKLPGRLQLRVRVVIRLLIHQGMRVQRSPENQRRSQPKKPERLLLHQGHLGITIQFDCLSFMPPEKRKGWISKRPKNSGITAKKREIFWLPSRLLNLSAASLWRNLALPTLGQNCPSYIYICVSFFISCLLYTKGGANWVGYRYQTSAPAGDIRCSRFKSCGEKNPAWESVSWLFQLGFPSYLAENMACPKPPNDNDTNLGEGTVHH